jgi:hypothetical protein
MYSLFLIGDIATAEMLLRHGGAANIVSLLGTENFYSQIDQFVLSRARIVSLVEAALAGSLPPPLIRLALQHLFASVP